jgi:membrane-associated protease RseP (regulator of RpoE activity)
LGQMVLIVAVAVALSLATGSFGAATVIAAIIAMIMLHELGHFLVAKASGMKVTEYFLGFGPRLWSVRKGETEYGVKALPLGGYVRIVGMNNLETVDPADEARSYRAQSFPRRLAVVLAGSAMHFLIAFVLLVVAFAWVGVAAEDPPPVVGATTKDSPAAAAGLRAGDRVVAVDGRPVVEWSKLRTYVNARPAQPIRFSVERAGRQVDLTITPADGSPQGVKGGFVGISVNWPNETVGVVPAVGKATGEFGNIAVNTLTRLASFFSPAHIKDYGSQLVGNRPAAGTKSGSDDGVRFLSPVGIGQAAGQAADSGILAVISLLIALNIGVGVFNLAPLLPLDGGHAAIAVYERIRSRRGHQYRADVAKLLPITSAVVGVLILIVVSSLWLDITSPMANPFQ